MIERYAHWIIKWRYPVAILTLLSILFLASGSRYLTFTDGYRIFFKKDNPYLIAFDNLQDTYNKNDNVYIMLEPADGNVFTPRTLQAVTELTEAAWQLPYSTRVDSISNFQHTSAQNDELTVEDLVTNPATKTPEELAHIKTIALDEPLLVNRLLSPTGHVTGVNVTVQLPGINTEAEGPAVVKPARELVEKFSQRYPDIHFYLTGVIMMNNAFKEAAHGDIQTLVPITFLVIIIGTLIFLRSFLGALCSTVIILLPIMGAMGTAGWLGFKLTPPSASAPVIILTLAVADCIHILVTFFIALRSGQSKNQAIVETLHSNFSAVFLTSFTTLIGFLGMNTSDIPPLRDLGNITAFGVTYAYILSIVLLPALLAILPFKTPTNANHKETTQRIKPFAEFVIKRHKILLWSITIITLCSIIYIPQNELNDEFVKYFDTSIKFRRDTDQVANNLTGFYFIDYSLDSRTPNGITDPAFLQDVEKFTTWYKQQPEVVHVSSFTSILKRLNKNMHNDDPNYYRIPDNKDIAAQYLLLYEMSLPYGLDLNSQLSVDKSATRLSVTLHNLSSNQIQSLEKRSQEWLINNAPRLHTQGASPSIMFAHIGQQNIRSMLIGAALSSILISFCLIFWLKSWKYGLISILPNIMPIAIAFGFWGYFVGQIGISLAIVASTTLGIVVDDTVHFLTKYLHARRKHNLETRDAIRYAFTHVGIALAVTTSVLIFGFMVLAQSHFQMNSSMGLMTTITIIIALMIDALFMPPLLIQLEEKKHADTTTAAPDQRMAA